MAMVCNHSPPVGSYYLDEVEALEGTDSKAWGFNPGV